MQTEIIIIGAGLAGARAAESLAAKGHSSLIVEARDRIGGRGYTRGFAEQAPLLELGGSWITPWHTRMQAACTRHRIELLPTVPVQSRHWHDGSALRTDGPVASADRVDYDRVIATIVSDAKRLKQGFDRDLAGAPLLSVSLQEYVDRHRVARSTLAQLMAWWTISGAGDPKTVSAGEFLASCGYIDGTPEGMMGALTHTLKPGVSMLAERMIAASGAKLQLSFPVARVEQSADGVKVIARDGRHLAAKAAIVALPFNILGDIDFAGALSASQQQSAQRGHDGRAVKLWLRLKGVPQGHLVTGGLGPLQWLFTPYAPDNGTILAVAFGLDDGSWHPNRRADVAAGLAAIAPQAELIGWDWHDWCGDPFARGTWLSTPAHGADLSSGTWARAGRLSFATSDIAPDGAGWFEGAMASGEQAADTVSAMLSQ
ncbi:flavin monoamine oxidase family protein [Dongia sp.]|uniref:flavin monoamine oxidase family protein n=1 Tax=Dongia sp. TaxID=1977262 RepID=UPI0035AF49FC